jgi:hypothetical protein
MIQPCAADHNRPAAQVNAALPPPPATRPGASRCAQPCPRTPRKAVPGPRLRATPLRGLLRDLARDPGPFAEYAPLVEPLSPHQAYLDITEDLKGILTTGVVTPAFSPCRR